MRADAASAGAEFKRLLDKKKIKESAPTKQRRSVTMPFEEGERAAEEIIETFKKDLNKIK